MWKAMGFASLLLLAIVGVAYAATPNMLGNGKGFAKGNSGLEAPNAVNGNANGNGMRAASQYPAEFAQFQQAIADNNYALALELHEQYGFGGRMFDSLTPEAFALKSQLHNALQSGDAAKAAKIRQQLSDLGLNFGNGIGKGMRNGQGFGKGSARGMGNCPNA